VILGRSAVKVDGFNVGTVFIMAGTLFWSIYAVYIKKLVKFIDPLAIIAFVSLFSIILFFPIVLIFGDIGRITEVSTNTIILLFGSGILGVGVGNVFYYHAVNHVGTSISAVFFLLLPLSVGLVAFLVLGETLTAIQIISGIILIFGCWVVIRLDKKRRSQAVEPGSANTEKAL